MIPTTKKIYIALGRAFTSLDDVGVYVIERGFHVADISQQPINGVMVIFCKVKRI